MLRIGRTTTGDAVTLTDKETSRHLHIIGGSGTGKSKLLEHFIRQDIEAGRGLCLIDPHGTLADKIEAWCAMRGWGRLRRIHSVRPGDAVHVPGFNPLRAIEGEAVSVRVDAMVAACAQAWGVRDLNETPRLQKILRALFYLLLVRGLTLVEGLDVLRAGDPEGVRRQLTEGLPDAAFETTWRELNALPRRDFAEYVESAVSRLSPFLASEAMRLVVGQTDRVIDFRRLMDNREVVLVNLGAREAFSYENARLLGTLIINDLFLSALGRSEEVARKRPFTLYIDEAYDFLTGDIERILDQTRKFGLHAVLAHHRLGQLRERGEGVYSAVMNISNKIVLGGLADEDAGVLAREIARGEIDLTRRKHTMTAPVVVGEEIVWLRSVGQSSGTTTSSAHSSSTATTESQGVTESAIEHFKALAGDNPELQALSATLSESHATSQTTGYGQTVGSAVSHASTSGQSEALRSVREERETSVQFLSIDEQFHLAQQQMRALPDQHALVKRRGTGAVAVRIDDVKRMGDLPGTVGRYRAFAALRSVFIRPIADARAEIAGRAAALIAPPAPLAEADFWQEDEPGGKHGVG